MLPVAGDANTVTEPVAVQAGRGGDQHGILAALLDLMAAEAAATVVLELDHRRTDGRDRVAAIAQGYRDDGLGGEQSLALDLQRGEGRRQRWHPGSSAGVGPARQQRQPGPDRSPVGHRRTQGSDYPQRALRVRAQASERGIDRRR